MVLAVLLMEAVAQRGQVSSGRREQATSRSKSEMGDVQSLDVSTLRADAVAESPTRALAIEEAFIVS